VSIDNWVFKLYYKFTTSLLLVSSVLTTSKQLFGSPIQCDSGAAADFVEKDVLESYCWMYSSWNIPPQYKGACSSSQKAASPRSEYKVSVVYNSYYQWVPLYLVFLGLLFYLPRLLWLTMEGGLMKFFGKGTMSRSIEDHDEKRDHLVTFFNKNIQNKFNVYFYGFIFCEILNVGTATAVLFLTNKFLNHRFLLYGLKVWRYYTLPEEEHRFELNPMCDTFPRIASCDYWRWGPGGRQENVSAICVLALNMINDKVFLIFWWWLVFIIVAGTSRLVFRLFQVKSGIVRFQMINLRMNRYFRRSSSKIDKIEAYIKQCKLGDWFVLYQLSKNLNRPFFMEFLTKISVEYDRDFDKDEEPLLGGTVLIEAKYQNDKLLGQMHKLIHEPKQNGRAPLCEEEDTGDNFLEMILQPTVLDDVDGKPGDDKKVDLEEDEEKEEKVHVKRNKSKVVRKEAVTSEKDIR